MVFLDVEIKGQPVGRIEMVLFTDVSPRAAENFRWGSTSQVGEAACV
jgi:cyclophilin family peptidyl-prolyl cis-trans isomerase